MNKELQAAAKYSFVTATGGVATEDERESAKKHSLSKMSIQEVTVGSIPDPATFRMQRSEQPGVLDMLWRPTCTLLPDHLTELIRNCHYKLDNLTFIVTLTHMTDKFATPQQISNSIKSLREHTLITLSAVPFFGLDFQNNTGGARTEIQAGNSFGDCLVKCKSNRNCQAFAFLDKKHCSLCSDKCFQTKLCAQGGSCFGGFIEVPNRVSFTVNVNLLYLHEYSKVNGDVVASFVLSEPLATSQWCGKYAPALQIIDHHEFTGDRPMPPGSPTIGEVLDIMRRHRVGGEPARTCRKKCSGVNAGDYLLEMLFPRQNLSFTLDALKNLSPPVTLASPDWIKQCEKALMYQRSLEPPISPTFMFELQCTCFTSVRSIVVKRPRNCQIWYGDKNYCEEVKLKVLGGVHLKPFSTL